MATVKVYTNIGQATDVLVRDLGLYIPNSSGLETFTTDDEIRALEESRDLLYYLTDDAFGVGSSTLYLNDGVSNIAQADVVAFLATVLLPPADGPFGVVTTDAAGEIATDLTFDGTATVTGLVLGGDINGGNTYTVANLPTPTNPGDATNKAYVDALAMAVGTWKELVLSPNQLDSTNDCIDQAIATYFDGNPVNTDTFVIQTTATTETFIFKNVPAGAFDVLIGGNADATMANLATQINTDSILWKAHVATTLQTINDGSGTSTTGRVVVIRRGNNSLADSYPDRIYGTWGTPASCQYVSYAGYLDYAPSTSANLPGADPAVKEFGFGRATANLLANEKHSTREDDIVYSWDPDAGIWQNLGSISIEAGAGLTKSGNVLNVGAGQGITVNANDVQVAWGVVGNVQPLGTAPGAGSNNTVAHIDHVHTHGDRGVDGAVSEHDARQVDVTGVYTNIGSPTEVETALSNINSALGGAKASKLLNFGTNLSVSAAGTRYLDTAGQVTGSSAPLRLLRSGIFKGASIVVDLVDGVRSYKLSIQLNGSEVASLALAGVLSNATTALAVAYTAGDFLRTAMIRTAGVGASTFNNVTVLVEMVDN